MTSACSRSSKSQANFGDIQKLQEGQKEILNTTQEILDILKNKSQLAWKTMIIFGVVTYVNLSSVTITYSPKMNSLYQISSKMLHKEKKEKRGGLAGIWTHDLPVRVLTITLWILRDKSIFFKVSLDKDNYFCTMQHFWGNLV